MIKQDTPRFNVGDRITKVGINPAVWAEVLFRDLAGHLLLQFSDTKQQRILTATGDEQALWWKWSEPAPAQEHEVWLWSNRQGLIHEQLTATAPQRYPIKLEWSKTTLPKGD